MKNYDKIATVVLPFVGYTLSTVAIKGLVLEAYPELVGRESSIMPSDLAHEDCRYGDRIFRSAGRSQLFVLPVAERTIKTVSVRSAGLSFAEAAKAARALLTVPLPKPAVTVTDAPKPATDAGKTIPTVVLTGNVPMSKTNGQASK